MTINHTEGPTFDHAEGLRLLAVVNKAMQDYRDFTGRSPVSDYEMLHVLAEFQEDGEDSEGNKLTADALDIIPVLYAANERPDAFGDDDHWQEANYAGFRQAVSEAVKRVGMSEPAEEED